MLKGTGCSTSGKAASREEARRGAKGETHHLAEEKAMRSHGITHTAQGWARSINKRVHVETDKHLTLKKARP